MFFATPNSERIKPSSRKELQKVVIVLKMRKVIAMMIWYRMLNLTILNDDSYIEYALVYIIEVYIYNAIIITFSFQTSLTRFKPIFHFRTP